MRKHRNGRDGGLQIPAASYDSVMRSRELKTARTKIVKMLANVERLITLWIILERPQSSRHGKRDVPKVHNTCRAS